LRAFRICKVAHGVNLDPGFVLLTKVARVTFLAWCCFCGGLQASYLGLAGKVIAGLFRGARILLAQHLDVGFPITYLRLILYEADALYKEAMAAMQQAEHDDGLAAAFGLLSQVLVDAKEGCELDELKSLLTAVQHAQGRLWERPPLTRLPSADRVHARGIPGGNTRLGRRSVLDGSAIRGPVVTFGAPAKPQHLPLALAVQWAKVNPFTPDHTGAKLFPAAHSALPAYELETSGSEPAVDEVSSDSTLERPDRTSMSVLEKVVQAVPGPVPGQMRKK